MSQGGEARPFILTRKLGRQRIATLRDYCRAQGATLNDAVLTAYYRCLGQRLAVSPGTELQIPVMVDMRRYLGGTDGSMSLANLTSMVITRLEYRLAEGFADTLGRVKAIMDEKKSSSIGLNGFFKLDLLYRMLGARLANRLLRSRLKNPLICVTNVGILDSARMYFGDLCPRDAYMCGAVKYKPHFQLAISSYDGELTLSVNLYGTASDQDLVLSLFDQIESELPDHAGVADRIAPLATMEGPPQAVSSGCGGTQALSEGKRQPRGHRQ